MKKQNSYWEKKSIWNFSGFLKAKFLRICPYGTAYLNKLVTQCMREVLVCSLFVLLLLWIWNRIWKNSSWGYLLESVLLAVYLTAMEVPNYKIQEKENKVYQELLIFFSRVKHRYMACRHIANAVFDAAEGMNYEIQRLAGELYQVLMECDRKEKVRQYVMGHRTNPYLNLFLIQAFEASDKGDVVQSEEVSLFSENVEHLRLELMEELYRRKRRSHEFAGYIFVSVAPFFMMPVLKQWGLDFAPELEFFYAGSGVILELVTFVVTVTIYELISRAKEIALFSEAEEEKIWNLECIYKLPFITGLVKNLERTESKFSCKVRRLLLLSGEQITYGRLCCRMLLIAGGTFLMLITFCLDVNRKERQAVLNNVKEIETIAPIANEEKRHILKFHILEVTKQCRFNSDVTEEEIRKLLKERIRLGNDSMENAAVREIKNKVSQYQKTKFSVLELLFCVMGSLGAGVLPLLKLQFRVQTSKSRSVSEVRQFQSILIMERHLHGMTVLGLLEDMEVFAKNFRGILRKCINSYGAGSQRALLQMKEEGSRLQENFEELADAFLSVDEVGIAMAFAEVESNRKLLEKMTQLEAEISMERKKENTELLAKIPMILAVGAYFILPFFIYSLQGVVEVFELLEEMQ